MAGTSWYSTAPDLSRRERGPIELPAALKVVDEYFERLKPSYATGEEALSETMFGFSRGDADFIEICLHAPNEITLTAEFPPSKGLIGRMRGTTREELSLKSSESLKHYMTAYFTMSLEQFRYHIAAGRRS